MIWTDAWLISKEQEGSVEHFGGFIFVCMMQWSANLDGLVATAAVGAAIDNYWCQESSNTQKCGGEAGTRQYTFQALTC
jgi:hypothetical protein